MTNPVPLVLGSSSGPPAQQRTGVIASASSEEVIVVVGGTAFPCSALSSYTDPRQGDLVEVVRTDARWTVLGRISGQGQNQVLNPSFEESAPGTFPDTWQMYNVTGLSAAAVRTRDGAPGGNQVLSVTSSDAAAATSIVYSSPIDVVVGQTWNLSAFVGGDYEITASATADAQLVALWFANETDLYPTTSATDTTVASLTDVSQVLPFTGISGPVTVPSGAVVMRVGLMSTVADGQALEWDLVTARAQGVPPAERGPVRYVNITANSATTVAEAVILNTGDITWRSGRAYRFVVKGFVQSNISGDRVRVRGRRDALGGLTLIDTNTGLGAINGANNNVAYHVENILANHTGTDIVENLVMTIERSSGTGNVLVAADASRPAYIEVEDIGPASAFPGSPQI